MVIYDVDVLSGEKQGIKIDGYKNRWSAFEKTEADGIEYFIFENDFWGDMACYLVVGYTEGVPVVVYETYDNLEQCLIDEDII